MTAGSASMNDQQRYKYGGTPFLIGAGILMTVLVLSSYDTMTSGKTEWHLWSTKLPIIIPTPVMVGFWWLSLALFGAATILALLPSVSIIIDNSEISAQSPITRGFKTISFPEIRDVEVGSKTFSIHSRNGKSITINSSFMSKRDYKEVLATVQTRSGRTA